MNQNSIHRRGFLGASALACSQWLRTFQECLAQGPEKTPRKAKRVVMIFHCGGPSHLDLWDPKPDAPSEIRGSFLTIPTRVPGVRFSELLPELAGINNQLAMIRTVNHQHTQHNSAMCWSITGRPYRLDSTLINPGPTDFPSLGSIVSHLTQKEPQKPGVAPYVITPFPSCDSYVYLTPGHFGGCLGKHADPFILNLDLSIPFMKNPFSGDSEKTGISLQDKMTLWDGLNKTKDDFSRQKQAAVAFLGDSQLQKASKLNKEPDKVREVYGKHPWGTAHLLARRLLEAGTRFVSIVNGPGIVWDTHKNNFETHKNKLVPPMQRAMVALIKDLIQRGLWEDTILLSLSDFGRTPKINSDSGRDHWPQCFTAFLGGGPIKPGAVYGTSDKTGSFPKDLPVSPADIHATVLRALGYSPENEFLQATDGRPFPATLGTPLTRLL